MTAESTIYKDIAQRTQGDIYMGVVGPVRTGKSTFIKKFMENLVIPNIEGEHRKERAIDELPQSSAGRTIMTTEPKFIPEEAASISLGDDVNIRVRMIDCVGYIVPSSLGYIENDNPRMVMTPWFDKEIPFNMAAEIGTQKVITEHSTIGIVVTTDGSISDIPREEYEQAEERVVNELREINKPFVMLLNCVDPKAQQSKDMAEELSCKYQVNVLPVSCLELDGEDIKVIMEKVLEEFPVKEICFNLPKWINTLNDDHWLKKSVYEGIFDTCKDMSRINEVKKSLSCLKEGEYIDRVDMENINMGMGSAEVKITVDRDLFYKILEETTGLDIGGEEGLLPCMLKLAKIKHEYEKVEGALHEVAATGYGIVMPGIDELELDDPEIVKQGGKYGVRLKASAPSIHMMQANITTEVNPIVGSEKQSEELVMYMLKEFEENPQKIWQSNIFGKSLHELVNEGLHNKLYRMPGDARIRLQETIERIINEGCNGLICIIL